MEGPAAAALTGPGRAGRGPVRLALLVLAVAVQALAALFFLVDVAMDLAEAGRTELLHNAVELAAVLALALGVGLLWLELRRVLARQARMADQLRVASGAFHELLEERFDGWSLTPAERDVALLLVKGLSLAEIAGLRDSAEGTVKAHCARVYAKAGVSGRTQLVSLFLEELMAGVPGR